MLALTWFSRPTRVEDFDCVGSSAHQAVPPSSAGWCCLPRKERSSAVLLRRLYSRKQS